MNDTTNVKIIKRTLTEAQRAKISASKLGKKREEFSEEWRANLSKACAGDNNPMAGKNHSEETKQLISEKMTGRKQDPEVVARRAAAQIGKIRDKTECVHCGKLVANNALKRWHGDNCKFKKDIINV